MTYQAVGRTSHAVESIFWVWTLFLRPALSGYFLSGLLNVTLKKQMLGWQVGAHL